MTPINKIAVVYHDPCFDGMASLTLSLLGIRQSSWFKPDTMELVAIPRNYDKAMPDLSAFDVIYVVDCGITAPLAVELMNLGKSVLILDHHASHLQEWRDWMLIPENSGFFNVLEDSDDNLRCEAHSGGFGNIYLCISKKDRAGCGVVCNYFFPQKKLPWLFQHIEEQDIYRWALDNTKEVISRLDIELFTPDHWEQLFKNLEKDSDSQEQWINEGKSLAVAREQGQRKHLKAVGLTIISRVFPGSDQAISYALINGKTSDSNGLAPIVFGEYPELDMLMVYAINSEGFVSVSLRGQNRVDLSKLTSAWVSCGFLLSGGGHFNAAGAKFNLAKFYKTFLES